MPAAPVVLILDMSVVTDEFVRVRRVLGGNHRLVPGGKTFGIDIADLVGPAAIVLDDLIHDPRCLLRALVAKQAARMALSVVPAKQGQKSPYASEKQGKTHSGPFRLDDDPSNVRIAGMFREIFRAFAGIGTKCVSV